jgi:hypothetical protein
MRQSQRWASSSRRTSAQRAGAGQISHALFVRPASVVTARPASNAHRSAGQSHAVPAEPVEILAVGFWPTLEGLTEHYADATAMSRIDDALAGPPTASAWQQVSGFCEW